MTTTTINATDLAAAARLLSLSTSLHGMSMGWDPEHEMWVDGPDEGAIFDAGYVAGLQAAARILADPAELAGLIRNIIADADGYVIDGPEDDESTDWDDFVQDYTALRNKLAA